MADRGREIFEASRDAGWVLEPLAKELLREHGLPVPDFRWARTREEAVRAAEEIGYPVVAKIVSPAVVHKSDVGGVVVGIEEDRELEGVFEKLSALERFEGILIEETARGAELIIGSKQDPQFGTIVLAGIGGTSVEIYKDVAIRMAPVSPTEALTALRSLRGRRLLEGYRGAEAVDLEGLTETIARFSELAHALRDEVDSIDLNPVFCSAEKTVIGDARLMLKQRA